ncbi:hypothetical protein J7E79_09550 [Bacillus sp. ISL-40]|uniref:hypothetical protein n=1 Tax=unclassified Bacillus (in: firmicutes) TaxID=185979 RepID=UPI001BE547E0|nr:MULTISPECIES: hypothetical protein [unclassified Bacillus (in: firmicutes)]MBT2697652.1 hypothetical protein [Bacillus sp. ISL-40]MBT2744728.1 hypothetical protein [Bacillus sp. ISL-77]
MDKKQKISWGVSFGSLALVAGMVSFLGLSNGDQASNQAALTQGQSFDGGNSSQYNQNDDSNNNFDSSDQYSNNNDQFNGNSNQQDQFSNGGGPGMGHQGGFDTTTGGT